ncbi:hypothetical protein WDW89_15905 [Deltaproteobacteria bacterium TL4]
MNQRDPNPKLKYSEWRPVGVCDQGGAARKAKFFTQKDFALITGPGINRTNWNQHPQVMKVVRRYANDVARISSLTQSMTRPSVVGIELVGAVLDYNRTPGLNQESVAGKVQFFQVEYADPVKRKNIHWWRILALTLLAVLLLVIGAGVLLKSTQRSKLHQSLSTCESRRTSSTYQSHLEKAQNQLNLHVNRLPPLFKLDKARSMCSQRSSSLIDREKRLLYCYMELKQASFLEEKQESALEYARRCVSNVCSKDLVYLRSVCRQL